MDLSLIKTHLLLNSELSFYASIMFQLNVFEDSSIPTACTNGKYIKFNPTFMDTLTRNEQIGIMTHEILHVAYLHMFRGKFLSLKKFNVAADYVINYYIINTLNLSLPKSALYDVQYAGMSAEEVYDLLPNGMEPDHNDLDDSDEDGEDEGDTAEAEVQGIVQQAVLESSMQNGNSKIPLDISERVAEELNPILPWQTILANYTNEKAQDDYSWQKRNLYYPNHYLPSLYSETIGTISVYVDCSGSVSNSELSQYITEIRSIISELNPTETHVVSFTTEITHHQVIEADDTPPIKIKGKGGTHIKEVSERINERDDAVNIIFTDGCYTPFEFNKPVLHIIINNKRYSNSAHEVIHAVI